MATDLQERPSAGYDSVEDIAKQAEQSRLRQSEIDEIQDLEAAFATDAVSGNDLPDNHPDKSAKQLKQDEPTIDSSTSSEDDDGDGLFSGRDDRTRGQKIASRLSGQRRKGIVAGIGITAVVSVASFFATQLPNIALNQLKNMLLDRVSRVQRMESRKYRRSTLNRITSLTSKEGRMTNKLITEMEGAGYRFEIKNKQILSISHPNGATLTGNGIGDHIDEFMETRHPWHTSRWKTKRMNAFYSRYKVSRTSPIDADKPRAGPDGKPEEPKTTVNRETAGDILEGDEDDTDSLRASESSNEDPAKKSEEDARLKELDEQGSDIGDEFDKAKKELIENGTDVDELADGGLIRATSEAGENISEDLARVVSESAAKQGVGSKMFGTFKSFANPLDIADRVCTIRNRTNAAISLARATRSYKLIRYVWVFINATDDANRGKASSKLMGELMKRISTEDANGVGVAGSPAFGYLIKSKFSKSSNDDTRSSVAVDGKPTGLIGGINSKLNAVPGMSTGCPIAQNPVVQVGAGVASIVAGIFTGGGSAALQQAFQQGLKVGVKEVIEQITERIVFKEIAKQALKGIAAELTFEAIMTITEMYVQKSLKLPYTGQEKGGQLGSILAAGMGASNKQRSLSAGFVPATKQQYAMAVQETLAMERAEMKEMSFKDKYLSPTNPRSVLFDTTLAFQLNNGSSLGKLSQNTATMAIANLNLFKFVSGLGSMFTTKAQAESADDIPFDTYTLGGSSNAGTELAVDASGNMQTILPDYIKNIDPDQNIKFLIDGGHIDPTTLEPISNTLNEHLENCVYKPDQFTELEGDDSYDCIAKQELTRRFKAYLAYADLSDSIEAEVAPGEIANSTAASAITPPTADSTSTPPSGGATGPIDISKTSIIPGTQERIATDVLPKFTEMLAAAQQSGVNLMPISSGWRDPQEQIALRKKNCPDWQNSPSSACRPPTAKPGTSNHEGGRAIDFSQMCYPNKTCPGNKRWEWLQANGSKYGFYPIKSEAWHWSTTGK